MTKTAKPHSAPGTKGSLIHAAARYDLLIWLLTLGRERRFREMLLDHARLQPGESVLDVGCGTGTLAIAPNDALALKARWSASTPRRR